MSHDDIFEGQLVTGLMLCLGCIAIHSIFMAVVSWASTSASRATSDLGAQPRIVLIMGAAVSALLIAHIIEVALWALAYAVLDAVPKQTDAFYFAFVNYTTLGYGDVLPVPRWRLLGPLTAMCGVLMFGWSTAVIFDVLRNIAQSRHSKYSEYSDSN